VRKFGQKIKFFQICSAAAALQQAAAPRRIAPRSASIALTIDTMYMFLALLGAVHHIEEQGTPKTGKIFEKSQLSNGSRWLSALNGKKLCRRGIFKSYVGIGPLT
jgi:hypothetical protein